jgi:hypothetical protein
LTPDDPFLTDEQSQELRDFLADLDANTDIDHPVAFNAIRDSVLNSDDFSFLEEAKSRLDRLLGR